MDKVDNRFELVMVSSKRARQLQIEGKDPMVPVDNDKPTVLALREIAEGLIDAKILVEKPSVDLEEEFTTEPAEAEAVAADAESTADDAEASAETPAEDSAEAPAEAADESTAEDDDSK